MASGAILSIELKRSHVYLFVIGPLSLEAFYMAWYVDTCDVPTIIYEETQYLRRTHSKGDEYSRY